MAGIMRRKFVQVIRKPMIILFLFVLPIVATIGFGKVLEKGQKELVVPIAVVDEDQSDYSKLLIERLSELSKIKLIHVSLEEAEKILFRNEVDSVFLFKQGFQENLLKEKREDTIEVWVTPSSMAVGIVRELFASEAIRLTSNIKAAAQVEELYVKKGIDLSNNTWEKAFKYTDQQWEPEPLMTIEYVQKSYQDKEQSLEKPIFQPYTGLWTFFTMLACFLTTDWVVKERNIIFSRLRTTYRGVTAYVLQTMGMYLLLHIIQATIMYTILWNEESIPFLGKMIVFVFASLTLSLLTASTTNNLNSYYIVSFLLVLIIGILGGSFFPLQELSNEFARLTILLPQSLFSAQLVGLQVILILIVSGVVWLFSIRRLQKNA